MHGEGTQTIVNYLEILGMFEARVASTINMLNMICFVFRHVLRCFSAFYVGTIFCMKSKVFSERATLLIPAVVIVRRY